MPVLGSVDGDSDYQVKGGQYGFYSEEEATASVAYFNLINIDNPGLYQVDYTASLQNPANTTSPVIQTLDSIVNSNIQPEGIDGIFSGSLFVYVADDDTLRTFDVDSSVGNLTNLTNFINISFLAEDDDSVFIAARPTTTNPNGFYSIIRIDRENPNTNSEVIAQDIKIENPLEAPTPDVNKSINLNAQVGQDSDNLYYRTFTEQAGGGTDKLELSIIRLSKTADPTDPVDAFINADESLNNGWPDGSRRGMSSAHVLGDFLYVVLYASDVDFDQEGGSGLYRKRLDDTDNLIEQTLSGLSGGLSYDPSLSIASGDALAVNNFASDGIVLINLPQSGYLERSSVTISRLGGNNFYVDNDRLFINDLGVISPESGGDINILVSSPLKFLNDVVTLQVDANGTVFFFHDDDGDTIESINITQGSTSGGAQIVWDTVLTNNLAAADNSTAVTVGDFNAGFGTLTMERAGRYLLTADLDIALSGSYTGNSEFLAVKLIRGTTVMYLRPLARVAHLNPAEVFGAGVHQIQIQLYPYLEVNDVISINSVIRIEEDQLNVFTIDLLSHSNFKFQRLGDD